MSDAVDPKIKLSHDVRALPHGQSNMLPLTFMGAGGKGYRIPQPFIPVRKKATMISSDEAMKRRALLNSEITT